MSLAVVGADFSNGKGPTRRFEIAMCNPGEPIILKREPGNKADNLAVAVYSARDIQIGYIRAEQAQWIGSQLESIKAVFQRPDTWGATIRMAFDGSDPVLPPEPPRKQNPRTADEWPPPEVKDDFGGI